MRITVIGTSNSIMKAGWTRQAGEIWNAAGDHWTNLSIGGSSARYAAFLLDDQEALFQADRIIIESAINDQMFISAKACTIDHAIASYAGILRRAEALGALDKLLILLFPRKVQMEGVTSDALISRLAAMFAHFGVDHLDLRPHLADWAAEEGMQGTATHSDANHISPAYQDMIGRLVAGHVLRSHVPTDEHLRQRAALGRMPDVRLRRLTVTSAAAVATKDVGTSLMRQLAMCLQPGQAVDLHGARYLVGAFIWTHAESGALTIGDGKAARRLNLRRAFRNIFLFDTFFPVVALGPSAQMRVGNDTGVRLFNVLGLAEADLQVDAATVEIVALVGADADPLCLAEEVQLVMRNLHGLRRIVMHWLHRRKALPMLRRARRLFRAKLSSLRRK